MSGVREDKLGDRQSFDMARDVQPACGYLTCLARRIQFLRGLLCGHGILSISPGYEEKISNRHRHLHLLDEPSNQPHRRYKTTK